MVKDWYHPYSKIVQEAKPSKIVQEAKPEVE
jgi:hypothetical protein